jgi:GNAT superfamily N-acetyltransferase
MMKENGTIRLIKINDDNESAFADILLEAFTEEGLSNYLYDFSNPQTRALFNSLGKLKLRLFAKGGHTAVAALVNGEIAGGALVYHPEKTPFFKAFAIYYSRLLFIFPKMLKALQIKRALKTKNLMQCPEEIQEPFYTFEILAVSKKYQGQGIGKMLINHIAELVKKDKKAKGIYIFTADKKNQLIYEKSGYETVAERHGEGITIYHLWMSIK